MKEILILGGGFGGVSAALTLVSKTLPGEANITLIDRNSYHLFRASLYEVATKEETQKNIAIPYSSIFPKKVNIVKKYVENIDTENKYVTTSDNHRYVYDYLIVSLGSQSADFNISGVAEYANSFLWLEDAVLIRKKIEQLFHQKVKNGTRVKIVVAGGGFTGTELTAELINYRKRLSGHHKTNEDLIEISIIQGPGALLAELDEKVSKLAYDRLDKSNVKLILGSRVENVSRNTLETDRKEKIDFDLLIWTCGVKGNDILAKSGLKVDGRGIVEVNTFMQILGFHNIFAVGDNALFANPSNNKPIPQVAEVAEDEGKIAAENVLRSIRGENLVPYNFKHLGYIIPLKGRFAVAQLNKFRIVGFLGWVLQQLVFLNYLLKILPLNNAFKRWNRFEMYLNENM